MPLLRRRPLLRAAAIRGGAYAAIQQLEKLRELHEQRALTDSEFAQQKLALLNFGSARASRE
jgi:hypothetical protein